MRTPWTRPASAPRPARTRRTPSPTCPATRGPPMPRMAGGSLPGSHSGSPALERAPLAPPCAGQHVTRPAHQAPPAAMPRPPSSARPMGHALFPPPTRTPPTNVARPITTPFFPPPARGPAHQTSSSGPYAPPSSRLQATGPAHQTPPIRYATPLFPPLVRDPAYSVPPGQYATPLFRL